MGVWGGARLELRTSADPWLFILLVHTLYAGGWVAPLAEGLETILRTFQGGLDAAHVPYSYGFSIILLTMLVKLVTFPLTKQQARERGARRGENGSKQYRGRA